ncbi:MAG: hypothetical protein WB564_09540 [Dehalococcoidia bacterium]
MGRTRVKFLRHLGIALIFLPELITTPFGVTLVLVARYLARRLESRQNKRLREIVKYYLAHTGHFSDDADGKSSAPGSIGRHTQSEERLISRQYTGSRSFVANLAPSVLQNWRDMRGRTVHHTMDMQSPSGRYQAGGSFRVESDWSNTSPKEEEVIHHTINMKRLSQRYEGQGSAVAHSSWARTSGAGEGVTHHSLNMKLLSQRYNTGGVRQTKVKQHTMNMDLVRQRYGSVVSYTMALRALHNNNFYYDIVSKGNVIGGY